MRRVDESLSQSRAQLNNDNKKENLTVLLSEKSGGGEGMWQLLAQARRDSFTSRGEKRFTFRTSASSPSVSAKIVAHCSTVAGIHSIKTIRLQPRLMQNEQINK